MKSQIWCVACGKSAQATEFLGKIPDTNMFAGNILSEVLDGGGLYHCPTCSLFFRYPRLDKQELDRLYQAGSESNWQASQGEREDWTITLKWIKDRFPNGAKILDVGCFDGNFLSQLPSNCQLFGIEIHNKAVEKAKERGVKIIAQDFDGLQYLESQFDVIVAFDVIEHVINPQLFINDLVKVVSPRGMIVIGSGNTDALSWRFMGARYWYCTIAEHLSFINPKWCRYVATENHLIVEDMYMFSHVNPVNAGWVIRLNELARNCLYRISPALAAALRSAGLSKQNITDYPQLKYMPPTWLTAKDHFVVKFQRN